MGYESVRFKEYARDVLKRRIKACLHPLQNDYHPELVLKEK